MKSFAIYLSAAACPCPLTGGKLPFLSQGFTVEAADRAAAYKLAIRTNTLPLMGQTLLVFIDGTQQLGNH